MTKKRLRIAQIAPLWIPVPPRTYGGIELMLSNLVEELVRRKYDITLFASADSKTTAKLISPIEKAIWLQKDLRSPHAAVVKLLKLVKERLSEFDLIHNHFSFFMFPLAFCDKLPPMLSTIHRPIDNLYAQSMKLFPKTHFCALSQDAKQSAEKQGIPIIDVVPNGIDTEFYEFNAKPRDYFLYLGRLNKEKGIITALELARQAKEKLVVAGNIVGADEWTYFMQGVQPRLNEQGVNFVGQVDFEEKVNLLKNAKALLFPIDRQEPFGLVMIEAMACGTPVIAFHRGSVSEVIEHNKTGFVVDNQEEMIEAMKNISTIERKTCRKLVEEKFNLDLMVSHYEKLYEKILKT